MKLGFVPLCALTAMAILFGLIMVTSCGDDDDDDGGGALESFCETYVEYLYRCDLPNLDQMGGPLDEEEGRARCEERFAEHSSSWLSCTRECMVTDNLCYGECIYDCDEELEFADTWKDGETDLLWQVNAEAKLSWEQAQNYCANLELGGHDDWRVPTIDELRSLVRGCPLTVTGGECDVTTSCTQEDDCLNAMCEGCVSWEGTHPWGYYLPKEINPYLPGGDDHCDIVWSATAAKLEDNEDPFQWIVDFVDGHLNYDTVEYAEDCVRCVRNAK